MMEIKLKFISGRTTDQESGCNSVVEDGRLYLSPKGYNYLCEQVEREDGRTDKDKISASIACLGVKGKDYERGLQRGFYLIVDYDMVNYAS